METKTAVRAFGALAQESRLAIYRLLVQAGSEGMPAGAIAGRLNLPPATLSFHLKGLSQAELVRFRQEGRFIIYAASFDTMNDLVAFLTENCCAGAACAPVCRPASTVKRRKAA